MHWCLRQLGGYKKFIAPCLYCVSSKDVVPFGSSLKFDNGTDVSLFSVSLSVSRQTRYDFWFWRVKG